MVRIISEPRNSIVRQYEKLFEMDHVTLTFEDDALRAIAKEALERKTGARGLRAIFEELMTTLMYEIPSRTDVDSVIITKDFAEHKTEPVLRLKESGEPAKLKAGGE